MPKRIVQKNQKKIADNKIGSNVKTDTALLVRMLLVHKPFQSWRIESYQWLCRWPCDESELRRGLFQNHRPCGVASDCYDPTKITYDELLEVFWQTHDPTTLNERGNDEGLISKRDFYYNDAQKENRTLQG